MKLVPCTKGQWLWTAAALARRSYVARSHARLVGNREPRDADCNHAAANSVASFASDFTAAEICAEMLHVSSQRPDADTGNTPSGQESTHAPDTQGMQSVSISSCCVRAFSVEMRFVELLMSYDPRYTNLDGTGSGTQRDCRRWQPAHLPARRQARLEHRDHARQAGSIYVAKGMRHDSLMLCVTSWSRLRLQHVAMF